MSPKVYIVFGHSPVLLDFELLHVGGGFGGRLRELGSPRLVRAESRREPQLEQVPLLQQLSAQRTQ